MDSSAWKGRRRLDDVEGDGDREEWASIGRHVTVAMGVVDKA